MEIFDFVQVPVRFFESHPYLTGVTAAQAAVTPVKYEFDISKVTCDLAQLKNWENNGWGKISSVTQPWIRKLMMTNVKSDDAVRD